MTIKEWLINRQTQRIENLKKVKAPQSLIDEEVSKLEAGPSGRNLDKFGHCEIEMTKDFNVEGDDPGMFPVVLFSCTNNHEILMFTRFLHEEGQVYIPGRGWRCEHVFERLAVIY